MPSPAMGIAVAALVVAIGGSAFAATHDASTGVTVCVPNVGPRPLLTPSRAKDCRKGYERREIGNEGPPGPRGPEGIGIAAEFESRKELTTHSGSPEEPDWAVDEPLGSPTWSGYGEANDLLLGEARIETPASSSCGVSVDGREVEGEAIVLIQDDYWPIGVVTIPAGSGTVTRPIVWGQRQERAEGTDEHFGTFRSGAEEVGRIWGSEYPGQNELRVLAADDCGANGGKSGGHFVVRYISIGVYEAKRFR